MLQPRHKTQKDKDEAGSDNWGGRRSYSHGHTLSAVLSLEDSRNLAPRSDRSPKRQVAMGFFRLSLVLTLLVSVQRAAADPMMLLSELVGCVDTRP